jgi:hypothetical protein
MIRCEELAEFPDRVLRQVFEFLDLGKEQVSSIKNMNDRSLESLSERDYKVIESVAGDILSCLGYTE